MRGRCSWLIVVMWSIGARLSLTPSLSFCVNLPQSASLLSRLECTLHHARMHKWALEKDLSTHTHILTHTHIPRPPLPPGGSQTQIIKFIHSFPVFAFLTFMSSGAISPKSSLQPSTVKCCYWLQLWLAVKGDRMLRSYEILCVSCSPVWLAKKKWWGFL